MMMMMMDRLPEDIYQIIFNYLIESINALIKLRTICKQWKEIANHSLYWLNGDLFIYAPSNYRKIVHQIQGSLVQGGHIFLHIDEEVLSISQVVFTVKVLQDSTFFVSNPLAPVNRYEQAVGICSKFLIKHQKYHKAWDRFLFWYPRLKWLIRGIEKWFDSFVFQLLSLGTWISLGASVYLVSDIENYSHELQWKGIVGFILIYWNCFFYACCLTLSSTVTMSRRFIFTYDYDDICQSLIKLDKGQPSVLLIVNTLVSMIFSFGLLQYSLSSPDPNFQYSFITLPFWLFYILNIILALKWGDREGEIYIMGIGLISLGTIYMSCTLATVYFDYPSNGEMTSLGYVFIPLILIELFLLIAAVYFIIDSLTLIVQYCRGKSIVHPKTFVRTFFRFAINWSKTFSMIGMLLILLNLNYQSFMNSLNLSISLMSIVMLLFLTQVFLYALRYDNRYLN